MTVLYFFLLVCSAAFGIYFSAWRPRFEERTPVNWFVTAIVCGVNGSLLVLLGFAALHNT